jgi:hypothetical protein
VIFAYRHENREQIERLILEKFILEIKSKMGDKAEVTLIPRAGCFIFRIVGSILACDGTISVSSDSVVVETRESDLSFNSLRLSNIRAQIDTVVGGYGLVPLAA